MYLTKGIIEVHITYAVDAGNPIAIDTPFARLTLAAGFDSAKRMRLRPSKSHFVEKQQELLQEERFLHLFLVKTIIQILLFLHWDLTGELVAEEALDRLFTYHSDSSHGDFDKPALQAADVEVREVNLASSSSSCL